MRTWIKALSALVILTLAPALWAESEPLSLGYVESGSIEIDLEGNETGSVSLYNDGELMFTVDSAGVTYCAPGVSWSSSGPYLIVNNLPAGNYTGTLTVVGGGSYSYHVPDYPSISWVSNFSNYWAMVTFIPY